MITPNDIPGFFADVSSLDLEKYILCDISFETTADPELSAANICCEMSTAQWKRPGINEDFRPRFGAKAISLEVLSVSNDPLYHFPWLEKGPYQRCKVRIAYPCENFGAKLPNLLSAFAGEGAFYCPGVSVLRLEDVHFSHSYLQQFQGPQFGVAGLRKLLGVYDRPFFVGVVKPNLGLPPQDFADLAYSSWIGGLDIAKDDEMLGDTDWSPLAERMRLCGAARLRAEKETGVSKMLLASITDEVDALLPLYEAAVSSGANSIMLNSFFVGFSSLRMVRKKATVPIMGHFTGMALYDRIPGFGIDGVVSVKLQRLAGCDIIGLPGFGDRMKNTDETVQRNIKACLEPMGSILPSLPIPGGSDWAGSLEKVYSKVGHTDFGFIAGRGVYGHPDGPKGGAQSLHDAWEAVQLGVSVDKMAKERPALRRALETFGG